MAWVTKSSTEQYQPEKTPQPQDLDWKRRASNWWYYHKFQLLAAVVCVGLAVMIVSETVNQVRPDYQVAYVGIYKLPAGTSESLTLALQQFGRDINGDGQVVVQINEYTVDFNAEETNPDAYNQMAGVTQLSTDLGSGAGSYIFLLEDPAGFQEQSGCLQYLDGTVGDPDVPPTDWENMVYRWTDCPVLAGLELGTYQDYNNDYYENQLVLQDLYVARRGVWDPEQADNFEGCADLWNALTAGAVPMEAAQ